MKVYLVSILTVTTLITSCLSHPMLRNVLEIKPLPQGQNQESLKYLEAFLDSYYEKNVAPYVERTLMRQLADKFETLKKNNALVSAIETQDLQKSKDVSEEAFPRIQAKPSKKNEEFKDPLDVMQGDQPWETYRENGGSEEKTEGKMSFYGIQPVVNFGRHSNLTNQEYLRTMRER